MLKIVLVWVPLPRIREAMRLFYLTKETALTAPPAPGSVFRFNLDGKASPQPWATNPGNYIVLDTEVRPGAYNQTFADEYYFGANDELVVTVNVKVRDQEQLSTEVVTSMIGKLVAVHGWVPGGFI